MSAWRSTTPRGAWPIPALPDKVAQGATIVAGAGVIGGIAWLSRRVVHPGVATAGSGSGGCGCFAPPGWTPPTVSTSCASCSACG